MIIDNLPPGCRDSDLPGYYDMEVAVDAYCDVCGDVTVEDVMVDSRGSEWEDQCPTEGCTQKLSGTYDPNRNGYDVDDPSWHL